MLKNTFSPWPSFSEDEANAFKKIILSNKANYWTEKNVEFLKKILLNFLIANTQLLLVMEQWL